VIGPWRARKRGGTLALSSSEDSLRYVFASESSERGATLASWGTEGRGYQTPETFRKRLKAALPKAERVIAVLDPREYQILQVEAPNVPAEELRSAVRWKAMEFLDGAPNDYTVDVLSQPGATAGKVIAVAARNEVVRALMLACENIGHPLAIIDICETAQRNLLRAVLLGEPDAPEVAGALVAEARRALLVVAVQGQLQYFRRFEFETDMVAVPVDEAQAALIGEGAGAETATRSLTQLNRSLDMWDDSYPHLPLATLRVDAGPRTAAIVERIRPDAGVDTRPLELATIFKVAAGRGAAAPWLDTAYLPLLGALLRPVEVPR
jgi:MSHA biogenesis protein MshI